MVKQKQKKVEECNHKWRSTFLYDERWPANRDLDVELQRCQLCLAERSIWPIEEEEEVEV